MPSDGQVKGELEIRQINGKEELILLVPTQFNFSSEPTRARLAKQLHEKLQQEIEWKEVMDYLCQKVQQLARAGDGCIEIYPDEKITPAEQLLEGIIYKGVQNIIYGEKEVLKSTIVYMLGMCVVLPWHDNPLDLEVPKTGIKALVLDWETDETLYRSCITRLQKGMDMPVCSMFYRRCALPLVDDLEAIQNHIETSKASLLIIDSLGAAAGGERGELKGAESALLFNSALRKIKTPSGPITSLIIAQTRKGDEDTKKHIYGSVYFTYYARNIFELCRGEEDYQDTIHLALFHRFCNLGEKMRPMGIRAEFDKANGGIKIEREPISIGEFVTKVSISTRILDTLKAGATSQKELKEELEVSYQSVGQALKRLSRQGKVQRVDDKWGLTLV
jgi:hypothetical protein